MKFKCDTKTISMMVIDAPKGSWRVLPPKRLQIVLTVVSIIVVSLVWSLF